MLNWDVEELRISDEFNGNRTGSDPISESQINRTLSNSRHPLWRTPIGSMRWTERSRNPESQSSGDNPKECVRTRNLIDYPIWVIDDNG